MKKWIVSLTAATVAAVTLLSGCVNLSGVDGKDGRDGKDASAYEYYEIAKSENPDLTVEEFLKQYLSVSDLDAFSLQASINRSLFSGVSIAAAFTVKYEGFWSRPTTSYSFGSGVIIDLDLDKGDAYVVTNCHVIYNDTATKHISDDVTLYLYGQDEEYLQEYSIPATVVGASRTYDIALLKVNGSKVLMSSSARAASFDTSDDVYVGETVYAVGNPEGYGISATQGIISKESETISVDLSSSNFVQDVKEYRVIRTDAAINGGNSGGGLFNLSGGLVGIVNAKAASEDIDNMGYALPASNVKRLVKLMQDNYLSGGFGSSTGVSQARIKAGYTAKNRTVKLVDDRAVISETVYVTTEGDGLLKDDAIRSVKITDANGKVVEEKQITRTHHLDDVLLSVRKGYTVTFTVSRGGEITEVPVTITNEHFLTLE
ncbi:MAG: S1C family serine protease [Clostridia bacterium]|nr:S1C family serine protease [Clostridia bacterium]